MATSKNSKPASSKRSNQKSVIVPAEQLKGDEAPEQLKTDLLDDFLFHSANYIYVKRKLFITLAVIALAILFSGYGIFKYIKYKDNQRNEQLFQIEKNVLNSTLTIEQQIQQGLPLLNEFIAKNPDTNQEILAVFYRAGLNFQQSKYQEAEEDLKKVLSAKEAGSDLFILASIYLANILRDQGKTEEAVEVLQGAKTDMMTDIILMEQAEMYMGNNQKDKAKELLEILLKDYPQSFFANKAKQLLEIL